MKIIYKEGGVSKKDKDNYTNSTRRNIIESTQVDSSSVQIATDELSGDVTVLHVNVCTQTNMQERESVLIEVN